MQPTADVDAGCLAHVLLSHAGSLATIPGFRSIVDYTAYPPKRFEDRPNRTGLQPFERLCEGLFELSGGRRYKQSLAQAAWDLAFRDDMVAAYKGRAPPKETVEGHRFLQARSLRILFAHCCKLQAQANAEAAQRAAAEASTAAEEIPETQADGTDSPIEAEQEEGAQVDGDSDNDSELYRLFANQLASSGATPATSPSPSPSPKQKGDSPKTNAPTSTKVSHMPFLDSIMGRKPPKKRRSKSKSKRKSKSDAKSQTKGKSKPAGKQNRDTRSPESLPTTTSSSSNTWVQIAPAAQPRDPKPEAAISTTFKRPAAAVAMPLGKAKGKGSAAPKVKAKPAVAPAPQVEEEKGEDGQEDAPTLKKRITHKPAAAEAPAAHEDHCDDEDDDPDEDLEVEDLDGSGLYTDEGGEEEAPVGDPALEVGEAPGDEAHFYDRDGSAWRLRLKRRVCERISTIQFRPFDKSQKWAQLVQYSDKQWVGAPDPESKSEQKIKKLFDYLVDHQCIEKTVVRRMKEHFRTHDA